MSDDRQEMIRIAASYSAIGIEMVIALVIGALGGRWLDDRFGTEPYLFWAGIVVGFGAAVSAVVRAVRRYQRENRS